MDYRELLLKYMKFNVANAACDCFYCQRDYAPKQVFSVDDFTELDKLEQEVKAILLKELDYRGPVPPKKVNELPH